MFFLNELQSKNCCECLNGLGNQLQTVFPAVLHLSAFSASQDRFFWALLLSRNDKQGKQSSLVQGHWLRRDIIPTVMLGLRYIQATHLSLGESPAVAFSYIWCF